MTKPFPDDQIDAIWTNLKYPSFVNSQALLQVDSYGGQSTPCRQARLPSRSARRSSSCSTRRTGRSTIKTMPTCAGSRRSTRPSTQTGGVPIANGPVTDGCFVNYCDTDLLDWPELYYKEGYRRLVAVKHAWDPLNPFRHAQSIGSA